MTRPRDGTELEMSVPASFFYRAGHASTKAISSLKFSVADFGRASKYVRFNEIINGHTGMPLLSTQFRHEPPTPKNSLQP